jgi:hypothetical protein
MSAAVSAPAPGLGLATVQAVPVLLQLHEVLLLVLLLPLLQEERMKRTAGGFV